MKERNPGCDAEVGAMQNPALLFPPFSAEEEGENTETERERERRER